MIFKRHKYNLSIQNSNELIQIEAYGKNSLRIRATYNSEFTKNNTLLPVCKIEPEIHIEKDSCVIKNGRITAKINANGIISFYKDTTPILAEYENPYAQTALRILSRDYKNIGGNDFAITVRFKNIDNEKIFGMGQYQQPNLNLKGCVLELAPRNSQVSIPFYLSNIGYGFLWNNPSIGKVTFASNITEWESVRSSEIDYWITVGETPKEIIKNFTDVVGRAPDFPQDLLGLWQCKLRYRTQEEVLAVAHEYKKRQLPLDIIVIDFYHWKHDGDWSFDEKYWPNPTQMVKELKDMNVKCMVSVWPTIQNNSYNFKEAEKKGYLVYTKNGEPGGIFGKQFYDATNPKAHKFIWEKCYKNYCKHGITNFWLDCCEPEFIPADFEHYVYSVGDAEKYANIYSVSHSKAFYDGMQEKGLKETVNLSRCGWVGSQRYGSIIWSGDIQSTFESLKTQICAGLNIGIAGIPWWTTDTAGFFGDINNPEYNELLIRWFQFSTFSPILRLHGNLAPFDIPNLSDDENSGGFVGTGQSHELWSHGQEVYEILKKYLFIRESLKDYIKSLTQEASKNGSPIIRTMFYEFPNDETCWDIKDQYMLGDKYLVAPILDMKQRSRKVYLPDGVWENFHSHEIYKGNVQIDVYAPLDIIPVFIKK